MPPYNAQEGQPEEALEIVEAPAAGPADNAGNQAEQPAIEAANESDGTVHVIPPEAAPAAAAAAADEQPQDASALQDDIGSAKSARSKRSTRSSDQTAAVAQSKKQKTDTATATATTKKPASRRNSASSAASSNSKDSAKKRSSPKKSTTTNAVAPAEEVDLSILLGYKDGDKVEVRWQIAHFNCKENKGKPLSQQVETLREVWWEATLLKWDGAAMEDGVAIRTIEYIALPEHEFFNKTKSKVLFLGKDMLIDLDEDKHMKYRRKPGKTKIRTTAGHSERTSETEEVFWYTPEQLADQLDTFLTQSLQKNFSKWTQISAAQQARMAETIAEKKEKLRLLLLAQKGVVVTPETIHELFAQVLK